MKNFVNKFFKFDKLWKMEVKFKFLCRLEKEFINKKLILKLNFLLIC